MKVLAIFFLVFCFESKLLIYLIKGKINEIFLANDSIITQIMDEFGKVNIKIKIYLHSKSNVVEKLIKMMFLPKSERERGKKIRRIKSKTNILLDDMSKEMCRCS